MRAVSPSGTGIPGISPAMMVDSGKLLFLSGHTPTDSTGALVAGGLEPQMEQVFKNLGATLAAAGGTFANVARLTIYIKDYSIDQLPLVRRVRDKWVNKDRPPASALIGVAALFHPDVLVEIDAIAGDF